MTDVKSGLSRRTAIKGAAWSVPVIAIAAAAPMAAASGQPTSVGSLVESSPNIKDTTLSASSSRVESCFATDNFQNVTFNLTATVAWDGTADGVPGFTLAGSGVRSAGNVWRIVSATATLVTLASTQAVSCFSGITGFELDYNNVLGSQPGLKSMTLNISGVSADGTRKIDGLVSALDGYTPVVGPKVHDV